MVERAERVAQPEVQLGDRIDLSLLGPEAWRQFAHKGLHGSLLLEMYRDPDYDPESGDIEAQVTGTQTTLRLLAASMSCEEIADVIECHIDKLPEKDRHNFDYQDPTMLYLRSYPEIFTEKVTERDLSTILKLLAILISSPYELYPTGFLAFVAQIWFDLSDKALNA